MSTTQEEVDSIKTVADGERIYRVEVKQRNNDNSGHIHELVITAHQLGIDRVTDCQAERIYFLQGALGASDVARLSQELLADPVTEAYDVTWDDRPNDDTGHNPSPTAHTIDVTLLPGVTDPAAENLLRAASLLNITGLDRVATGHRFILSGALTSNDLQRLATEVCSNPVIQRYAIDRAIDPPFFPYQQTDETVERIPLREVDDQDLLRISSARRLALDLAEMQAIRSYYRREERDPSDVELEMLAQTWSEHCVHKTFKALINYKQNVDSPPASPHGTSPLLIDGLLRTYIRSATEHLNKTWVHSAFVDNAGIIAFDDQWDLAFKVETHNHPSALEPFGGANTGVGGVIRDILGVSARPIANTDVLCFGPQDLPLAELPAGVLHPRRIADGVVRGVEDYGNKMGIPTINGAILYHPGYTANPLVFCGCLGILPRDSHPSQPQPGDLVIVVGGRTGRDGLRGATFSSMEMDQATGEVAGSAVQIGHPIHEKQVMEVVLRARDERLYDALTDCGAGGLSSAVGELGKNLGVRMQLASVPLKYPGLRPWEIWLSEAQERMVLAVPPANWARLQAICEGQSIEAVCIGTFEATGRLQLSYGAHLVADLDMHFLHDGFPRRRLDAVHERDTNHQGSTVSNRRAFQSAKPMRLDPGPALLALLAHPNIRSKESVIRLYDHEVQGATAVKPLTGVANHGPSDAAVLVPLDTIAGSRRPGDSMSSLPTMGQSWVATKGVALSAGICPNYAELDPYAMAWAAVDEAMRNAIAVGANPDQVAILDNFCWGNPNLPDRLGSLVRCAQGCYDAAIAYGTPFISGKDSLNNEYTAADGRKHGIPGTLLISAIGIVPNVNHVATMDLKAAGNPLYIVGDTRAELGGSHYSEYVRESQMGSQEMWLTPPQPIPHALDRLRAVHRAIASGLIQACHDCSEGGIGVALSEMALAGRLGAEINLANVCGASAIARDDAVLFSESLSRFIVEVRPADIPAFETAMAGVRYGHIGQVLDQGTLIIHGRTQADIVNLPIQDIEFAWRGLKEEATHSDAGTKSVPIHNGQPAIRGRVAATARQPRVLILHATGTNRDRDAALACELAGGAPEIVHVNQLAGGERKLLDYAMLVIPGGFSYGDDLGAGTLWALDLRHRLGEGVARFVADGRPVLGICNGFQALVKAGLLPGVETEVVSFAGADDRSVTLAPNTSAHFECRWVYLMPEPNSNCIFTAGLDELIYCPVAHGEGRIAAKDSQSLAALQSNGFIALTYVEANGQPARYPGNPNGSALGIAGLTNKAGNILGLMPHPENHIFPWQHPRARRGERGLYGLRLFENGIEHARD